VEYGDVQIATNTFPADQYHLIDNRRRAVGADALLPPEDVITGMERYWLELGRQACPPLTVYIRDLVA
jgi:hypothetical protein